MWWRLVRNIIRGAKGSTYRTADGAVQIRSDSFNGISLSAQREINDIIENESVRQLKAGLGPGQTLESLQDVRNRSASLGSVVNSVAGPASLVQRVTDALGYRDYMLGGHGSFGGGGGISNLSWTTGINGQDPAKNSRVSPNLYISPVESANIYSQGGLARIILEKKAKTMLNNGVQIKNSRLSPAQLSDVQEDMVKTGLAKAISDALRDSLTYGGSLLYPNFLADTPLSMTMPVPMLEAYGVIGKGSITRWTVLDRWNTVHFPCWDPTAADFIKPEYFYIPFLGCDVHSSRVARIVTSPQPGYWGVMRSMGWGVSDIPSWIEALLNYYNVMQSIPTMINQMSILARTFNVDGPLAMEGAMMLDQMADETTIRVRESSPLNPVNLDLVGKLEAIQRDFAEVPELTRLIRQDLAAKAGLLEQSLFTVEKRGMGSGGDGGQESWSRQEETNKFMYSDAQSQLKQVAMLQIINALGTDNDIVNALPYTEIVFDEQRIVDVADKTEVLKSGTKGFFDIVAGGMPLADAAEMVEQLSGGLMSLDNELLEQLKVRQELMDRREEEKHEAEIALAKAQTKAATTNSVGSSNSDDKKGHSYEDPLEQKKHEKVRQKGSGTQKQGLAKAKAKAKTGGSS